MRVGRVLHGSGSPDEPYGVNGPGLRSVVWLQGCTLACKGCINMWSWSENSVLARDVAPRSFARELVEGSDEGTKGVTLSGGEPLQQAAEVLEFVRELKRLQPDWSVFMFTGHTDREVLTELSHEAALLLTRECDVTVTGRFERSRRCHGVWRGSGNQQVVFRSDRYRHLEDGLKHQIPLVGEIHLNNDGTLIKTGFTARSVNL